MAEIERMRGDLTLARIKDQWTSWRGRAVEPLVRESLARILPDDQLPAAPVVGAYWTRSNDVEIDLVGADREPVAKRLLFLGSIKWLEKTAFDNHDLAALQSTEQRSPTTLSRWLPYLAMALTAPDSRRHTAQPTCWQPGATMALDPSLRSAWLEA